MRVEPTQPITPSEVETAQNQLLRAGFSLPRYGADGLFGRETSAAVTRFQKANGLAATGTLDLDTLQALANARSPSPDYAAIFSDGVLRAVLAVGYDEAGSHEPEQARVRPDSRSAATRPSPMISARRSASTPKATTSRDDSSRAR